ERVEPHVDDALFVPWDGNAPGLSRAADRDVLEPGLEQPQDLVPADDGFKELRMRREMRFEGLGVLRETEEVVLLTNPVGLRQVDRTFAVDEILLLLEGLAGHAIPALVDAFVDVARLAAPAHQLLDRGAMARLSRTDEVVERDVEALPCRPELLLHPVAVRHGLEAELARLLEDVLRVFVVTHDEPRLEAHETTVPGDDVGGNLLVGRPEVGATVDVVDGSGQVEPAHYPILW